MCIHYSTGETINQAKKAWEPSSCDEGSSNDLPVAVKDNRLARSDRILSGSEPDRYPVPLQGSDKGWLRSAGGTYLCSDLHLSGKLIDCHPAGVIAGEIFTEGVLSVPHRDDIVLCIKGGDIEWTVRGDTQSFPLSDGIVPEPPVGTEDVPACCPVSPLREDRWSGGRCNDRCRSPDSLPCPAGTARAQPPAFCSPPSSFLPEGRGSDEAGPASGGRESSSGPSVRPAATSRVSLSP